MQTSQTPVTREDAVRLANEAMAKHGLTDKGWRFRLNTNRSRLGVCKFAKTRGRGMFRTVVPVKRIEISIHCIAMGFDTFNDTLLHEIAHALAGPEAKHGPVWRAIAREIGCTAQRCGKMDAPAKYLGTCGCGYTAKRNRVTNRMFTLAHTPCLRKGLNNNGAIAWRTAAGRALRPSVSHPYQILTVFGQPGKGNSFFVGA
jgi:hypothetical protein